MFLNPYNVKNVEKQLQIMKKEQGEENIHSRYTTKKQTIMLLLKGGLTEEQILKLPKITRQDIEEAKQEYTQISKIQKR